MQRGAAECQTCNERIYLAAVIRLRLRRAEIFLPFYLSESLALSYSARRSRNQTLDA